MDNDVLGQLQPRPAGVTVGVSGNALSTWGPALVALSICIAGALFISWPVVIAAVRVWYNSRTFNHCFLVPFIAAFMIWERRGEIAELTPRPILWPALLVAVFGVAGFVGGLLSILELEQFALISTLLGFALCILGWQVCKTIVYPLLYLFFLVPSGEFLVPWLQDVTGAFAVKGLQLSGVPVYSDGVFLTVPTGIFEVAEACAGLRFLIASVAFGALFAYLVYRRWWSRAGFILLSIVIPIIANGIRAYGIVMIAYLSDNRLAAGVDHIVYGWVFFVAVLLVMTWIGFALRDPERDDDPVHLPVPVTSTLRRAPRSVVLVAMVAFAAAAVGPAAGRTIEQAARQPRPVALAPPAAIGDWRLANARDGSWRPVFPGADGEINAGYDGPAGHATLYVAYYSEQRYGAKVVSTANRFEDNADWRRISAGSSRTVIAGQTYPVDTEALISARGARRLVWTLYWVDGRLTGSPTVAKMLGARAQLFGGNRGAAVVAVASDYTDSPADAARRIDDFLKHFNPASVLSAGAAGG
ncbi:MAG TPA: exosortase A [Candidatus Cybelea sp.]|nr:exosortase A [Candidatus Cybelea sp.]